MATKKTSSTSLTLEKQAAQILKQAQASGLQGNFFFETTFNRYMVQMKIMKDLEAEINDLGATVSKEYVKGRKNVYTNPAITEYNKTCTAANQTVATLLNILKQFSGGREASTANDPLMKALKGE